MRSSYNDQLLERFGGASLVATAYNQPKKLDTFSKKARDVEGVETKETVVEEQEEPAEKQELQLSKQATTAGHSTAGNKSTTNQRIAKIMATPVQSGSAKVKRAHMSG